MRALEFIRDRVTFKLPYDFSYQMKPPLDGTIVKGQGLTATLFVDIELGKCTIKSITESVNFISTIDSLLPLLYEPCRSDQIRSAICRLYLDLQIDSLHPDVFDKTCYVHWLQKRALCIRGPEVPESIGTWGLVPC